MAECYCGPLVTPFTPRFFCADSPILVLVFTAVSVRCGEHVEKVDIFRCITSHTGINIPAPSSPPLLFLEYNSCRLDQVLKGVLVVGGVHCCPILIRGRQTRHVVKVKITPDGSSPRRVDLQRHIAYVIADVVQSLLHQRRIGSNRRRRRRRKQSSMIAIDATVQASIQDARRCG